MPSGVGEGHIIYSTETRQRVRFVDFRQPRLEPITNVGYGLVQVFKFLPNFLPRVNKKFDAP